MAKFDSALDLHLLLVGGDGRPSGVPRHIRHLLRALSEQVKITVASEANQGGYQDLGSARHMVVPGLSSRLSLSHLVRGWRGLYRLLHSEHYNIVWLHARVPVLLGRLMLTVRLWRPEAETRVVVTYHGLPFGPGHKRLASNLSRLIEKCILSACPPLHLVFLSQSQIGMMERAVGANCLKRHRVHMLPNSSDIGLLPAPSARRAGQRHLVMTGRCGWQKNYPQALRFFAHLPSDFTLTLCGLGTQNEKFQAEATRILTPQALKRVRFEGPLIDVRPVLASADGYLLTSRYEGLPIGALEAFEAGLPIILNNFEGAEELASLHPMALCMTFDDLPRNAERTVDLIDQYIVNRDKAEEKIRGAWKANWSYDQFATRARLLLTDILD